MLCAWAMRSRLGMWINTSVKKGSMGLVKRGLRGTTKASRDEYQLQVKRGKVFFFLNNGRKALKLKGGAAADGRWHFITAVVQGDQVMLYVDGELKSRRTRKSPIRVVADAQLVGTLDPERGFFRGALDELKIHKMAISAQQVREEFLKTAP